MQSLGLPHFGKNIEWILLHSRVYKNHNLWKKYYFFLPGKTVRQQPHSHFINNKRTLYKHYTKNKGEGKKTIQRWKNYTAMSTSRQGLNPGKKLRLIL
jgi:hypothetical protein